MGKGELHQLARTKDYIRVPGVYRIDNRAARTNTRGHLEHYIDVLNALDLLGMG